MPSATNTPPSTSRSRGTGAGLPAEPAGASVTEELETWIEKIVDGGKDGSVPRQVFLGGVSGWVTGFLAMKVGKAAATAVGGGIILLQLANHKGYININWNRLNTDVERISKQIKKEATGKKDWTDKLESKLMKAADKAEAALGRGEQDARRWYHKLAYGEDLKVKELEIFFAAFVAGIGLGIITGG